MGLDQYLEARRFVSGYSHSKDDEQNMYKGLLEVVGLTEAADERFLTVSVNVAYWRKANHIHNWFVANVQDGVDDCKSYWVSRDKLMELEALCRRVVATQDPEFSKENLPTGAGFFFGSEDYDEYYYENTEWTAKRLAHILAEIPDKSDMTGVEFYYSSSW